MNIKNILKKNKKRITSERIEIFKFISKKHIFDSNDILKNFENIGRASVFRTINLFLELGIIRVIKKDKSGDSYEIVDEKHSHEHMECGDCGDILNFESEKIYKEITKNAEKLGFKIENKIINISGKCKKCK
ncbi:hypothetical protein DLH72_00685 [Candidatus Gracilibacteria bacterium]|nr:MAG: hypothetical protein DLH72_00685 [Candidatus Gracilibacteria bacterium]